MTETTLTRDDIARRGEALYSDRLRAVVETPESIGKMLILDVETGDYEIDRSGLIANKRLLARRPDTNLYGIRIGFDVVEGFGGFAPKRIKGGSQK